MYCCCAPRLSISISPPPIHARAGRQRTYTTQAGEMTLVLELLDGTTGEILVRIVDRHRGRA